MKIVDGKLVWDLPPRTEVTFKIQGGIGFHKTMEYLFSDFLGTGPKIERVGKLKRVHTMANPRKFYIDEKGQVFSYLHGAGFKFCYFTT